MRYLITGGAGFIGSHLSEALLNRGDEVFVLDDLSIGSVENIRHLKTNSRFHYVFDSIMNKHLLAELVDESDMIFHLAAAVGVRLIVESPVRTIETNVYGTQLVLDAASKKKKLVFTASTSEVYGKSDKVPFHEDSDLVLGPTSKGRWSYAASKALDEFLALSFWKEKKLNQPDPGRGGEWPVCAKRNRGQDSSGFAERTVFASRLNFAGVWADWICILFHILVIRVSWIYQILQRSDLCLQCSIAVKVMR